MAEPLYKQLKTSHIFIVTAAKVDALWPVGVRNPVNAPSYHMRFNDVVKSSTKL